MFLPLSYWLEYNKEIHDNYILASGFHSIPISKQETPTYFNSYETSVIVSNIFLSHWSSNVIDNEGVKYQTYAQNTKTSRKNKVASFSFLLFLKKMILSHFLTLLSLNYITFVQCQVGKKYFRILFWLLTMFKIQTSPRSFKSMTPGGRHQMRWSAQSSKTFTGYI